MGEVLDGRYWCHMCSQIINPVFEVEIKCPFCENGFVEEMGEDRQDQQEEEDTDVGSDRAVSLWAPILLGMMGVGSRHHPRSRRESDESEEDDDETQVRRGGDLESILRRRRRNSAAILQLLRGIRAGILEQENESGREQHHQHREHLILINPFNQAIILQGSSSLDANHLANGALGDYLIGPGLDELLQHLADNDPNLYGTPPAKKDAVEALPTVTIAENLQCAVCLDDFQIGSEGKEMPCNHKFHTSCIFPWLKLHSSCPVCRFQMPFDEVGGGLVSSPNDTSNEEEERSGTNSEGGEGGNGNGRRNNWPWPFHGLFSQSGGNSSSPAFGSDNHHADEN